MVSPHERGSAALTVLITAPWARRLGGAEEMLWAFLRHHDPSRVRPAVVFMEAGPFEREVAALGIPTAVVQAGQLRSPVRVGRTVGALTRRIRRERPAVVLNWMAKTQLYGAPAAALSGTGARVVWWQHLIPSGHWMDRLATALPTAAIGACSETAAGAQRHAWPARPTTSVHPGIDAARPSPTTVTRADLALPAASTVVTIVGRLQPWKGQDRLLRAVAGLRAEGDDLTLLVVGGSAFGFDEDEPDRLRALAAELGLAEHVRFTGQVDDARPFLALSDIAVNASESEPFGIVVLEAMAAGVPVVAVDAGGPREILEDGRSGVLVRNGSPQALADGLRPLVRDPALRSRIGAAGRERFAERFTAEVMTGRITELLERVASR